MVFSADAPYRVSRRQAEARNGDILSLLRGVALSLKTSNVTVRVRNVGNQSAKSVPEQNAVIENLLEMEAISLWHATRTRLISTSFDRFLLPQGEVFHKFSTKNTSFPQVVEENWVQNRL